MSESEVLDCVVAFYRLRDGGDLDLIGHASADVLHGKYDSGQRRGFWASAVVNGDARDLARGITERHVSDAYLAFGETLLRIKMTEWSDRRMRVNATQRVPIPVPPHLYRAARIQGMRDFELFGVEPSPPRPTSEWYEDEKARVYREVLGYVEPEGVAS